MKFCTEIVENIVGKGGNAGSAFSPFPTIFPKGVVFSFLNEKSGLFGNYLVLKFVVCKCAQF